MVVNTNDWISLQGETNGSGNGSFTYLVAQNPSLNSRTGTVTVADEVLVLIRAAPLHLCSFARHAHARAWCRHRNSWHRGHGWLHLERG